MKPSLPFVLAVVLGLFFAGAHAACAAEAANAATLPPQAALAPLAKGVTSFGAAVCDGALYICAGNEGGQHDYAAKNQSTRFSRLSLKPGATWEELPAVPHLQGLALVACNGKVCRLGGFAAKNEDSGKPDFWSTAECAAFDPQTNAWQPLPDLPEPRSSFDAVAVGSKIYAVGGWTLAGGRSGTWLDTAWVLDLSADKPAWQPLPALPEKRRALSVAATKDALYAMGGMGDDNRPSGSAWRFDLAQQTWSPLPEIAGGPMKAFGSAAYCVGDTVYLSTVEGSLRSLASGQTEWQQVGRTAPARFFHRMVATPDNCLLLVGGATDDDEKCLEVQTYAVSSK